MQQDAFPGEDISDRPLPAAVVPALIALHRTVTGPAAGIAAVDLQAGAGGDPMTAAGPTDRSAHPERTARLRSPSRARGSSHPRPGGSPATRSGCWWPTGTTGRLSDTHFSELPRFLHDGDLVVVNTSGTLAAELVGRDTLGREIEVRLSTQLPAGLWTVELRRSGQPYFDAPAGLRSICPAADGRRCSPPTPSIPKGSGCGWRRRDSRPAAQLPVHPRPTHPVRVHPGRVADLGLPERLRHRAGIGRDAQRRPAVHPRDPHPIGGRRGRNHARSSSIPGSPPSKPPSPRIPSTSGCRR